MSEWFAAFFETTDVPTFWVQVAVAVGTIGLAVFSFVGLSKATKASNEANRIAERAVAEAKKSAEENTRMRELETERTQAALEAEERDQASRIWVSMIVLRSSNPPEHGVLQIRNNSDRPVRNMLIESRGRISGKEWFPKEPCTVPVVYPGDTIIRSRSSTTNWSFPENYFPTFPEQKNHAVGPRSDPHYVLSVRFEDANGKMWELEHGHSLKAVDAPRSGC